MNDTSMLSFAPALGLLLFLVLLAWGVQWMKRRMGPQGSGQGAELRLLAQMPLGPQQRVVVVEVMGAQGPVQLTLGVTPQHVRTLHTQAVPGQRPATVSPIDTTPSYKEVAAAVKAASGDQP